MGVAPAPAVFLQHITRRGLRSIQTEKVKFKPRRIKKMIDAQSNPYFWTDQQFDQMSWHDNNVHALRIVEGEWGSGELILDLDYIIEWIKTDGKLQFRLLPAKLKFLGVTDLRLNLDYKSCSAATQSFCIHAIERRFDVRERYTAQVWKILINWPRGEFEFDATGFEQLGIGPPTVSDLQYLEPKQRNQITL